MVSSAEEDGSESGLQQKPEFREQGHHKSRDGQRNNKSKSKSRSRSKSKSRNKIIPDGLASWVVKGRGELSLSSSEGDTPQNPGAGRCGWMTVKGRGELVSKTHQNQNVMRTRLLNP